MTDATVTISDLAWEPPGPGSWTQLPDHYPRPITRATETFVEAWAEGAGAYIEELGLPMGEPRMALVNGLPYVTFPPPGKPGAKQPPDWLLRILVRLSPSMRRAEATLARIFAERPWVEGARRWYATDRPAAIDRLTQLTRVEPDGLDDADLAAHLVGCVQELRSSGEQHMRLHVHDEPPPLLFAVRMSDWGFDPSESLALLAGSSPVSAGASEELEGLRAALGGRNATSLEQVRHLGPEVAAALDLFLERHGLRLVDGYDIDGPCLIEVPALVVRLISAPPPPDRTAEHEAAVAAARARVPAGDRPEFDLRLTDARTANGLRDDNGGILISWPTGLLRRAVLAAGHRLAGSGHLTEPELAIEADPADLAAALRDGRSIDEADLARRSAHRRSLRASDAPLTLGPPEPPPPTGLPGALGLVMRMFALGGAGAGPAAPPLEGIGLGSEPYEGTARLVTGAGRGLDDFVPGEVLVAPMTSPSYNVVLAGAGALVTEQGDLTSHAAIMARELDLPAVIGAAGATTLIRDGDRVRVDPASGAVQILDPRTRPDAPTMEAR